MANYMNISDEAQSLLIEIANNRNDATALTICQVNVLGKFASPSVENTIPTAQELEKAGIVKISKPGKELILDSIHIDEFRRQFPVEKST